MSRKSFLSFQFIKWEKNKKDFGVLVVGIVAILILNVVGFGLYNNSEAAEWDPLYVKKGEIFVCQYDVSDWGNRRGHSEGNVLSAQHFSSAFFALKGSIISSGRFANDVDNFGTISNGEFYASVYNHYGGLISGGVFDTEDTDPDPWYCIVTNLEDITGGTFKGIVFNFGDISDGVFQNSVRGRGNISGGTFNSIVEGQTISGGSFKNDPTLKNTIKVGYSSSYDSVSDMYNVSASTGAPGSTPAIDPGISGGTYTADFDNSGVISGGTFNCEVNNEDGAIITGGDFKGSFTAIDDAEQLVLILGGTFNCGGSYGLPYFGASAVIFDGTFNNGAYLQAGGVLGGTFYGDVINEGGDGIIGGTFHGDVDNSDGSICGGVFNGEVSGGKIYGGTFNDAVTGGKIYGGTFNSSVSGAKIRAGIFKNDPSDDNTIMSGYYTYFDSTINMYRVTDEITNLVGNTINTGTYEYCLMNSGIISGGDFQEVINIDNATISDGVFNASVTNTLGAISGGEFYYYVLNDTTGTISSGVFNEAVFNYGDILGGVFNSYVDGMGDGNIKGGVFNEEVSYSTLVGGAYKYNPTDSGDNIIPSGYSVIYKSEDAMYYIVLNNASGNILANDTYYSPVNNDGTINSGTFNNAVTGTGLITGGTFNATVEGNDIEGGNFIGTVTNVDGKNISGGNFTSDITNNGKISDGIFAVVITGTGTITGGTFNNTVSAGSISGGVFNNTVNCSNITGGSFKFDPTASLASGYVANYENGMYVVTEEATPTPSPTPTPTPTPSACPMVPPVVRSEDNLPDSIALQTGFCFTDPNDIQSASGGKIEAGDVKTNTSIGYTELDTTKAHELLSAKTGTETPAEKLRAFSFGTVTQDSELEGKVIMTAYTLIIDNPEITDPSKFSIYNVSSSGARGFDYISKLSDAKDGTFTIQNMDGSIATTIESGVTYMLATFVKDGGTFDIDGQADGSIFLSIILDTLKEEQSAAAPIRTITDSSATPSDATAAQTLSELESKISYQFTEQDIKQDVNGKYITINPEIAKNITQEDEITPLPIIYTEPNNENAGKVIATSLKVPSDYFLGLTDPLDVKLYNIINSTTAIELKNISDLSQAADGTCIIQNTDGTIATQIEHGKEYIVTLFIQDGGDYDSGVSNDGAISAVPVIAAETDQDTGNSGYQHIPSTSGGGCNAGVNGVTLIIPAIILAVQRKKKG